MTDYFRQLQTALATLDDDDLAHLNALVRRTVERDGTIWLAGNGGSASVAQHWACDLSKAAGIRAQALGTNAAILTAYANDKSYAIALAEELERCGRPGDSLVCLSCSGTSPNITAALRQAWLMKLPRALVTGYQGVIVTPVDAVVTVQGQDYGILEDVFAAIGHWLTQEVRDVLHRTER